MAKNAPNLALAFNLPPERAVEYFRSRGTRIAGDWKSAAVAVRSRSFSVAAGMKEQVLDEIRAALQEALESGQSYEGFKRGLVPKLQAAGWLGAPGKGIKPRRMDEIFRTNIQAAFAAPAAGQDEFDALAAAMASEWERTLRPVVDPIEQLLAECKTPEGFRARLSQLPEQMDHAPLAGLLASGTFAARLVGLAGGEND
jgi:uncharacterized protein with gpF-like domain